MAYFEFQQSAPDGSIRSFVFKLTDATLISKARAVIAGKTGEHVQGTIVAKPVPYNPGWAFHLEPSSIRFFVFAMEVCDANVTYVAEHLAEVGTDFLPNDHWCPWSSEIVREVSNLIDPETELLSRS